MGYVEGFIPDPIGIALIAKSPIMTAIMEEYAIQVEEHAKSIAPVGDEVDSEGDAPGAYKDSIQHTSGVSEYSSEGVVFSDIRYAGFLEFGTVDTPAFHTLRTALEMSGLEVH